MTTQDEKPEATEATETVTSSHEAKERRCLRCQESFMSGWSGERVCTKCKSSHGWRSGVLPMRMGRAS